MIGVINIDIYRMSVILVYQENKENVRKWLKKHCVNITDDEIAGVQECVEELNENKCGGVTYKAQCWHFVILKEDYPYELTHECFHATHNILSKCSVTLSEDEEEYAYLLGYITSNVMYLIDEYQEKQKGESSKNTSMQTY